MSGWIDRRKKHHLSIKLDDVEMFIVEDIANAINDSVSEAIRRSVWVYRILYDHDLKLKDALMCLDPDKPLYECLAPIPVLAHKLGIDVEAWHKMNKKQKKRRRSDKK